MTTQPIYTPDTFQFCANARVRVSATGTKLPDDFSTAYGPEWTELGYIDEKGVVIDDGKTLVDIKSLQNFYPVLKLISDKKHTVQFNLQSWTRQSISLGFGGGTWTTDTAKQIATYAPPDPSYLDTRQLAIDWVRGGYNWRWVVFRGIVSSNIQTSLVKTNEALLPITLEALGQSQMGGGTDEPWAIQTNSPDFLAAE